MTSTLGTIAGGATLPINLPALIDTRALVQGMSGSGKSWLLRRLLEQTFGQAQHIVLDSQGEFASLRERHPYLLAAPTGGEAVATVRTAPLLARRLLETQVSAVVDVFDLGLNGKRGFVRAFLRALLDAPRRLWHPLLLVLDEAHDFCPEAGASESAASVIEVASTGRKRGLGLILATQRLSKLHKDAAAEMQNKLLGMTTLDVDVRRAADDMGLPKAEARDLLRALAPGEFYGYGPAISREMQRIQVGPVATTHPRVGEHHKLTTPATPKALAEVLGRFADLPADAEKEASSVERLQAEVVQLRRQLAQAQKAQPQPPPAEIRERVVEVVPDRLRKAVLAAADLVRQQSEAPNMTRIYPAVAPGVVQRQRLPPPAAANASIAGVKAGAVRILRELASRTPAGYTRAQVATLTGFSPRGGTFLTYLGVLKRAEYLDETEGLLRCTGRGLAALGDDVPPAPTTHDEMMAMWRRALKAGAHRMLEVIVASGHSGATRQEVAAKLEMEISGGTFNTYLGILRRNGLIFENGDKRCFASDMLCGLQVP